MTNGCGRPERNAYRDPSGLRLTSLAATAGMALPSTTTTVAMPSLALAGRCRPRVPRTTSKNMDRDRKPRVLVTRSAVA